MTRAALILPVVLFAAPASAGEFNKTLSVGDAAPEWAGLPGTDGKKHSWDEFRGAVTVVAFTCNSCPVAVGYEDRLIALAKRLDGKARVVAINSNTIPADGLPEMVKRAEKKKFPFPYLHDATQEVARKYGANYTPEFVVVGRDGKVAYLGALDDKSPPAAATVPHVENAVAAALEGKPAPVGETLARGCRIRFAAKKSADD